MNYKTIEKVGKVIISDDGIEVTGFEFNCNDNEMINIPYIDYCRYDALVFARNILEEAILEANDRIVKW